MLKKGKFLLKGATEQKRKKEKVRKDKLVKRKEKGSLNKVYTVNKIL